MKIVTFKISVDPSSYRPCFRRYCGYAAFCNDKMRDLCVCYDPDKLLDAGVAGWPVELARGFLEALVEAEVQSRQP